MQLKINEIISHEWNLFYFYTTEISAVSKIMVATFPLLIINKYNNNNYDNKYFYQWEENAGAQKKDQRTDETQLGQSHALLQS